MVDLQCIQPRPGRRERQAVAGVFALEPAGAEPAERPAAGDRVQAGQDLGQQRRRAERHRRDQGAQLDPFGHPGQIAEGDVGLRDRVPGPADLRDLQQVIHHRDRRRNRPAPQRSATDAEPAARVLTPRERRDLQGEPEPGRAGGARRDLVHRSGRSTDAGPMLHPTVRAAGVDGEHQVEPVRGQVERPRTGGTGSSAPAPGTGRSRSRLRARQTSRAVLNRTATTGSPAARPSATSGFAAVGVESEGVDDRGQSTPQPGRDDGVQHRERIDRGIQIALAAADGCPQRVRGDDLVAGEMPPGPGGLARAGRPDQQHQAPAAESPTRIDTLTRQLGVLTECRGGRPAVQPLRASRSGSGPYGRVGVRRARGVQADAPGRQQGHRRPGRPAGTSAASHIEVQATGTMCSTFPASNETRMLRDASVAPGRSGCRTRRSAATSRRTRPRSRRRLRPRRGGTGSAGAGTPRRPSTPTSQQPERHDARREDGEGQQRPDQAPVQHVPADHQRSRSTASRP